MNKKFGIWIIFMSYLMCLFSMSIPEYFRLETAYFIFSIISISILLTDFLSFQKNNSINDSGIKISLEKIYSFTLLAILFIIQSAFVNDHIFGSHPEKTSLYNGVFTHGGYMPYTDNAHYLISIQSFLRYGMTVSMAIFRPSGVLWSAFLYKISGESMIVYFYLQAFLSSVGIWALAVSMRYFFSWFWILLLCLFMSMYVGLFQGTFMTELASMPFALLSLSMIIFGWIERRKTLTGIGLSLLAMAFEMRPAVFILPPFLFLLMGLSSRREGTFSWKSFFIAMLVYVLTVVSIRTSILLLEYPPPPVSNTYGKLYQIYSGSEAWNEANKINPGKGITDILQIHQYRQDYVHRLILDDPMPLIQNYFSRLLRTFSEMPQYFEVIDPMMSNTASFLLFSLLFFGFMIHRGRRAILLIHALVLSYFMAAMFAFPFLHAEFRVMSVTQPIVVLAFVMALNNLWIIGRSFIFNILSALGSNAIMHHVSYHESSIGYNVFISWSKYVKIASVVLLVLSILAPLCIDKVRSEVPSALFSVNENTQSLSDSSRQLFVLDLQNSPKMHFVPGEVSVSLSPATMSLNRIKDRWVIDSTLNNGFYLFNALNHVNFPEKKSYAVQLVIPDNLIVGLDLDRIEFLLLEVRKTKVENGHFVFRNYNAERIVSSISIDH